MCTRIITEEQIQSPCMYLIIYFAESGKQQFRSEVHIQRENPEKQHQIVPCKTSRGKQHTQPLMAQHPVDSGHVISELLSVWSVNDVGGGPEELLLPV